MNMNVKLEDEKVVCLMFNGAKLSQLARDMLLDNACWMFNERQQRVVVRHPAICGVIESNLKAQNYLGTSSVQFKAMVEQCHRTTTVTFIVRVSDLTGSTNTKWLKSRNMDLPEYLKVAIAKAIEEETGDQVEVVGGGILQKEDEDPVDPNMN